MHLNLGGIIHEWMTPLILKTLNMPQADLASVGGFHCILEIWARASAFNNALDHCYCVEEEWKMNCEGQEALYTYNEVQHMLYRRVIVQFHYSMTSRVNMPYHSNVKTKILSDATVGWSFKIYMSMILWSREIYGKKETSLISFFNVFKSSWLPSLQSDRFRKNRS